MKQYALGQNIENLQDFFNGEKTLINAFGFHKAVKMGYLKDTRLLSDNGKLYWTTSSQKSMDKELYEILLRIKEDFLPSYKIDEVI